MRRIIAGTLALTLLSSTLMLGSEPTKKKKAAKKPAGPNVSEQLQQMKDQLNGQQQQINQLQQQLQQSNQQLQQAQQQLQSGVSAASQQAQTAAQQAAAAQDTASSLNSQVADLKTTTASTSQMLQSTQKAVKTLEAPASVAYKGVKLTPGGFVNLEAYGRSRNNGTTAVATNWFNIPLDGSTNAHIANFRETAQQSRISLKAEGKVNDRIKLTGYYEADWNTAGFSTNDNESNSFNLRERQLFGRVETSSGWGVTAGQMWTLATPNRKGVSPLLEYIPLALDGQYVIGFQWARQPGLRIEKTSGAMSVAFAVENPSTIVTGTFPGNFPTGTQVLGLNNSVNALTPVTNMPVAPFTATTTLPGSATAGTGTTTVGGGAAANFMPDGIAKLAWDGKRGHFEVKAIGTFGRDRVLIPLATVPTVAGLDPFGKGDSTVSFGGGAGVGVVIPITKKADFVFNGLAGQATGRYLSGTLGSTDWTYNTRGELQPIKSEGAMAGIEFHPSAKLDWYVYGGQEYYQRTKPTFVLVGGKASPVGYGNPLTSYATCANEGATQCAANNRALLEAAAGFIYRWYRGPYGTFQTAMGYAYAYRATWSGGATAGTSLAAPFTYNTATTANFNPKGSENIGNVTLRYILP